MAPLADQDCVAVVEVGDDKSRVRVGQGGVKRLCLIRKADNVLAQDEWAGAPRDRGGDDIERPPIFRVREVGYLLTTTATAAAAAATCRVSGP